MTSECVKGVFRSPLIKTLERSVKTLGLEFKLVKLHSFSRRVTFKLSDCLPGCYVNCKTLIIPGGTLECCWSLEHCFPRHLYLVL